MEFMKKHILTIVLLVLAAIAFTLGFYVPEEYKNYCGIIAFSFPSLVAIFEMILAEQSSNALKKEIEKRPIWETLSQEEYDRRKEEGTLDETTFYATTEE